MDMRSKFRTAVMILQFRLGIGYFLLELGGGERFSLLHEEGDGTISSLPPDVSKAVENAQNIREIEDVLYRYCDSRNRRMLS